MDNNSASYKGNVHYVIVNFYKNINVKFLSLRHNEQTHSTSYHTEQGFFSTLHYKTAKCQILYALLLIKTVYFCIDLHT